MRPQTLRSRLRRLKCDLVSYFCTKLECQRRQSAAKPCCAAQADGQNRVSFVAGCSSAKISSTSATVMRLATKCSDGPQHVLQFSLRGGVTIPTTYGDNDRSARSRSRGVIRSCVRVAKNTSDQYMMTSGTVDSMVQQDIAPARGC